MKAALFDIGGVIVADHILKKRALEAFRTSDMERLWALFNEHLTAACRGEEPLAECWRKVAEQMDVQLSEEELQALWIKGYEDDIVIDQEVVAIIRRLSGKYKLAVISNTIGEHALKLREMGVYDGFDAVILSHEVRLTKESPAIFKIALSALGVEPGEALFVDDVERFTKTAEALGMKSVLFKNASQLGVELREKGFVF